MNSLYFLLILAVVLFLIYLRYQVKIKNNKNYPVSLAMGLAFLIVAGNTLPVEDIFSKNMDTLLTLLGDTKND